MLFIQLIAAYTFSKVHLLLKAQVKNTKIIIASIIRGSAHQILQYRTRIAVNKRHELRYSSLRYINGPFNLEFYFPVSLLGKWEPILDLKHQSFWVKNRYIFRFLIHSTKCPFRKSESICPSSSNA